MSDDTTEMFSPSVMGPAEKPKAYRVLARKYRPSNFDDLIGQEPMVRTLSNAFATNRIHQAYILTGVRGVGKTTTARILARALNYELPGKVNAPTVDMPELGVHCQAIIDSRHVDVIEMDAASHTGIDDVREIIESARYRPVSARMKVYIIDEVHMLSKQAFNGLLKTLEEPPEHVKFLFATTEIDKVPITVRSRCQRFDLRRVEVETLVPHLGKICLQEGVTIEPEALAMIARAAEGSVRDSLSLLDQAIAHGINNSIDAESVRQMLGLADRGRIIALFEQVMAGRCAEALTALREQYDLGADPAQILTELAEFVHFVTRLHIVPDAAKSPGLSPQERDKGLHFAGALPLAILTRAWQMLLKGLAEVKDSPNPLASAEMVLVRLCYAADLPPPDKLLKRIQELDRLVHSGAPNAPGQSAAPASSGPRQSASLDRPVSTFASAGSSALGLRGATAFAAQGQPASAAPRPALRSISSQNLSIQQSPMQAAISQPAISQAQSSRELPTFAALIALAEEKRDSLLKIQLERDVRLIRFEQGRIEFELGPQGSPALAATLGKKLLDWTGSRWMVAVSSQPGAPSLQEQANQAAKAALDQAAAHPLVQAAMSAFPGAKIAAVRNRDETAQIEEPVETRQSDDDIAFLDSQYPEEDL